MTYGFQKKLWLSIFADTLATAIYRVGLALRRGRTSETSRALTKANGGRTEPPRRSMAAVWHQAVKLVRRLLDAFAVSSECSLRSDHYPNTLVLSVDSHRGS